MRTFLLAVLLFCAALMAPAASAAAPQPLQTGADSAHGGVQYTVPVLDGQGTYPDPDQSGWVFNNQRNATGERCVWNDQDDVMRAGSGYVDPGAPFVDSLCLVADYAGGNSIFPHNVYINVYAPKAALNVSLINDVGDSWQVSAPVKAGSQVLYRFCVDDPVAVRGGATHEAQLPAIWPVVPDSNGGYGQVVNYALTIASATGQRVRDVWSKFEIATDYTLPPMSGERHQLDGC